MLIHVAQLLSMQQNPDEEDVSAIPFLHKMCKWNQ